MTPQRTELGEHVYQAGRRWFFRLLRDATNRYGFHIGRDRYARRFYGLVLEPDISSWSWPLFSTTRTRLMLWAGRRIAGVTLPFSLPEHEETVT